MRKTLEKLIRLANNLDKKGLYEEASELDKIISIAANSSGLIRALKNDSADESRKALQDFVSQLPSHVSPAEELGMDSGQFHDFFKAVDDGDLGAARKLFGVELDSPQSPQTHNPLTGKPWPSGPVPQQSWPPQSSHDDVIKWLYDIDDKFVRATGSHDSNAQLNNEHSIRIFYKFADETALDDFISQNFPPNFRAKFKDAEVFTYRARANNGVVIKILSQQDELTDVADAVAKWMPVITDDDLLS